MKVPLCRRILLISLSFVATAGAQSLPATRPTTMPTAMPAEQMLDRLLQSKPGMSQPLQPVEQSTEKPLLRKEGEFIRQRVGRLVRGAQNELPTFNLEADGAALQDPPLTLLPCTELEKMEEALKKASRDLRFRVTGTISLYRDKNYLFVERAEIAPDAVHP